MGVLRWILLGRRDGLRARVRRRLWQRIHPGRGVRPPDPSAARAQEPASVPGGVVPPPGYVAVLPLSELSEGGLREVLVGSRSVALAMVGGEVHAMDGTCPHAGGPLAEGELDGTTLRCPLHGWTFDIVTGACHVNPEDRITILEVRVVGDVVCVEV
jgi:nitrite reductase (NADH) small subunit